MSVPDSNPPIEEMFGSRGKPDVREKLVDRYISLVESLARRYHGSGEALEDLIQVAAVGLLKAIDRFDLSRGIGFESFAVPTILGELKRYRRDQGWSVHVPRKLQEHALLIRECESSLIQELGRSPSLVEVAERAGLSEEEVLEAMDAGDAYASLSLDAPVGGGPVRPTLGEQLAEGEGEFEIAEGWADLEPYLWALDERDRRIIALRFFADRTQTEIAAELGLSQVWVSRLLSQALRSLREAVLRTNRH